MNVLRYYMSSLNWTLVWLAQEVFGTANVFGFMSDYWLNGHGWPNDLK